MHAQASIRIDANGHNTTIETRLALDDLERNGIGGCEPVKALAPGNPHARLGTYLNVADICRAHGRSLDELGVLRRLAREFGRDIADVGARIAALTAAPMPEPALPRGWSIVAVDRDEARFKTLAGIGGELYADFWHPGARLGGLAGTPGLEGLPRNPTLENASFHVLCDDVCVATVPVVVNALHAAAWVTNHPSSGCLPIEIHFTHALANHEAVYKVVLIYLQHVVRSFGANRFVIGEPAGAGGLLYKQIIKRFRLYAAEVWDQPYVDLTQDESRIFTAVRKSYKSNINWCAKHLEVQYLSGADISGDNVPYVYAVIQDLHREIIEKYTDGMTTELFMHPMFMCKNGQGEVAIAKTADGTPWGITVTTYDGGIGYYALAGSRIFEGRNVGHFIAYDAIKRAKAKGMTKYVMNRPFGPSITLDGTAAKVSIERSSNIAFFKRGFSDDCDFFHVYQVSA